MKFTGAEDVALLTGELEYDSYRKAVAVSLDLTTGEVSGFLEEDDFSSPPKKPGIMPVAELTRPASIEGIYARLCLRLCSVAERGRSPGDPARKFYADSRGERYPVYAITDALAGSALKHAKCHAYDTPGGELWEDEAGRFHIFGFRGDAVCFYCRGLDAKGAGRAYELFSGGDITEVERAASAFKPWKSGYSLLFAAARRKIFYEERFFDGSARLLSDFNGETFRLRLDPDGLTPDEAAALRVFRLPGFLRSPGGWSGVWEYGE